MPTKERVEDIDFYRVDNDIDGSTRYVFHFLALANTYNEAIKKAKDIGARVYRGKWFGGGLVVQSYNLEDTARFIRKVKETI